MLLLLYKITLQKELIFMKKDIKKTEGKVMDIKKLAWQNFYETGEIGAYLLYKKLCEEDDGANNNAGDSPESE